MKKLVLFIAGALLVMTSLNAKSINLNENKLAECPEVSNYNDHDFLDLSNYSDDEIDAVRRHAIDAAIRGISVRNKFSMTLDIQLYTFYMMVYSKKRKELGLPITPNIGTGGGGGTSGGGTSGGGTGGGGKNGPVACPTDQESNRKTLA